MSARSNGSVRRLNSLGTRSGTNGSAQTCSVPCDPLLHEDDLPVVEPERRARRRRRRSRPGPCAGSSPPRRSGRAAGCSRRCAPCTSSRRSSCPAFSFSTTSGVAGGGEERRQPVVVLDDLVGHHAGRDVARPADHLRDPERALPVGVLLAAERGHAAVGPGVHVRAVVGGVDDDRVVGDAQLVELVEQLADVACRGRSSCRGTATASGRPGRRSPASGGSGSACGWCSSRRRTACPPRAGRPMKSLARRRRSRRRWSPSASWSADRCPRSAACRAAVAAVVGVVVGRRSPRSGSRRAAGRAR